MVPYDTNEEGTRFVSIRVLGNIKVPPQALADGFLRLIPDTLVTGCRAAVDFDKEKRRISALSRDDSTAFELTEVSQLGLIFGF
ncbi:MAG: hypothetical protein Q9208_004887 [Pyrenodesmia sp. 3 TL-2023]